MGLCYIGNGVMVNILFNRKIALLSLVILNFSVDAKFSLKKSLGELRASIAKRDQNDCATVVNKKLDQICKKYVDEISVLDQSSGDEWLQAKLNLMIVNKAQETSYFYVRAGDALYSYRTDLLRSIKILNRFKNGRFLRDQQILNSNAEVARALNRLNQIQAKLLQIDELIRHDARFVEQVKKIKFWTVACCTIGLIIGIGIGLACTGLLIYFVIADLGLSQAIGAAVVAPELILGSLYGLGGGIAGAVSLNRQVKEFNVLINQEEPAYV